MTSIDRRISITLIGCLWLATFPRAEFDGSVAAQERRPVLRPVRRDYFAGRLLLIPRDTRAASFHSLRQLARLADHDLILPPAMRLDHPSNLIAWVRQQDYGDLDGVIISLESLGQSPSSLLDEIRSRRPGLPVYGFSGSADPALGLLESGRLDHLLLGIPKTEEAGASDRLAQEVRARRLDGRVTLTSELETAPHTLIARLVNQRFGLRPKVWPILSAPAPTLVETVVARIRAVDGIEQLSSASGVDLLLFIHTPSTNDEQRGLLAESAARALTQGYRIAIADLTDAPEQLLAALRSRKLLDRVMAYAAPGEMEQALGLTLAQAALRTLSLRFLRDDIDRLQRTERAQVESLADRYLADWAYRSVVRPKLEAFRRENPGASAERVETFARDELRRIAEELFNEQFLRNVHDILLETGERARFEVRSLQRILFRVPGPGIDQAELRQSIYIPFIDLFPSSPTPRVWELVDAENLDPRLIRYFEAGNWTSYEIGTELAEIRIGLNQRDLAPEGYAISSRLRRGIRRIEINASTPRGGFYALGRLEALGREGKLGADFQLNEAPALEARGVLENVDGPVWPARARLDLLRFLGRMRMNRYYYLPPGDPLTAARWRETYAGPELERFKDLVRVAEENFVELVYGIRPASAASDQDLKALLWKIDSLAALGVRRFLLSFDQLAAHSSLIARASEHLRAKGPDYGLTVTSDSAAPGVTLPPGVEILRPAEAGATGDRRLILVDYPANDGAPWRLRLGPVRRESGLEGALGLIARPMTQLYASLLPLATFADYAWSPKSYDSRQAFDAALRSLYDERSRAGVKVWAEVFGGAENIFAPLFSSSGGEIDLAALEGKLGELDAALAAIASSRERGLLRGELARFLARAQVALARIRNDPAYQRQENGKYLRRME